MKRRNIFNYLVIFCSLAPLLAFGQREKIDSIADFLKEKKVFGQTLLNRVENGTIVSNSIVESNDKENWQSLDFYVTGINKNSCRKTLRKTSQYEQFKEFFTYVTESTYDEKSRNIFVRIDSKLLPIPMILDFKIDRVDKPGAYSFTFEKGMLNGLKGNIHVYKYKDSCFVYADGKWKGLKTKFPNLVIELFTETLSKITLIKLYRLSES